MFYNSDSGYNIFQRMKSFLLGKTNHLSWTNCQQHSDSVRSSKLYFCREFFSKPTCAFVITFYGSGSLSHGNNLLTYFDCFQRVCKKVAVIELKEKVKKGIKIWREIVNTLRFAGDSWTCRKWRFRRFRNGSCTAKCILRENK